MPGGGGVPARAGSSAPAVVGADRGGAAPIGYVQQPGYLWMEVAWTAMPSAVRDRATEYIAPEDCTSGRWFVDNKDGKWRLIMVGPRAIVLIVPSFNVPGKSDRYLFPLHADTIEVQDLSAVKPVPPVSSPGSRRVARVEATVDAPTDWNVVIPAFPYIGQDILERWFPPTKEARRFAAALLTCNGAEEQLWAFAGTKRRVVYLYAHRAVATDPLGGEAATERRRLAQPWRVLVLRAQCVAPNTGSGLAPAVRGFDVTAGGRGQPRSVGKTSAPLARPRPRGEES